MNTEKCLESYSPLKIQCKSFQIVIERYILVQETGLFLMYAFFSIFYLLLHTKLNSGLQKGQFHFRSTVISLPSTAQIVNNNN